MDDNAIAGALITMMPVSGGLMALSFFLLWFALWQQKAITILGVWVNRFFFVIFLLSVFNTYLVTYLSRAASGANIDGVSEWTLITGLNLMPLAATAVGLMVGHWTRKADAYVVSNEGVFGTLAQAMPIIVADQTGTIQHTTPAFDELARAAPGELVGRDLKSIMPERYRDRHDGGMAHYVQTREARIVGTVVTVEMLRLDNTEVPVYLALNTTDVDGAPWFVAALWEHHPPTVDEAIAAKDARDLRQDTREDNLDERALGLDKRGWDMSKESMAQEDMRNDLEDREDAMDEREAEGPV